MVEIERILEQDDDFILGKLGEFVDTSPHTREQVVGSNVSDFLSHHDASRQDSGVVTPQVGYWVSQFTDVRDQLDKEFRAEENGLYALQRSVGRGVLKVVGAKRKIASLDDMMHTQLDNIEHLQGALSNSLVQSEAVLNHLIDYQDTQILPDFVNAIQHYEEADQDLERMEEGYELARAKLARITPRDKHYLEYKLTFNRLKRSIMQLHNTKTKASQSIAFKDWELEQVEDYEDIVQLATGVVDRMSDHVREVVGHVRNTQPVYTYFKERFVEMTAVFDAYTELSRLVLKREQDVGNSLEQMTQMSRLASYENNLPGKLAESTKQYRASLIEVDAESRKHYDSRAEDIMGRYALNPAELPKEISPPQ